MRRHLTTTLSLAAVALFVLVPLLADDTKAPTDLKPGESCSTKTCHTDIKKPEHLHGPVASDECVECHVLKAENKHDFKDLVEGKDLCETCHDPVEKQKSFHEPVGEDCTTCHSPHGGDDKAFLTMPQVELCEACHDEEVARAKEGTSTHSAAVKGKACLTCHAGHTSEFPKLLAAKPMDACLSCHDKDIKVGERTIPSTKKEITAHDFVHGPIEDEECHACHDAHGSKHVALLKHAYPSKFYAPFTDKAYDLCFQCHEAGLVTTTETDEETEFRNGTQNLHYLHVNKKKKGRTCRACHATHASKQPSQVRTSVPFGRGGWSLPIKFTKTDTGGTCASGCHVPRKYDREKPEQY